MPLLLFMGDADVAGVFPDAGQCRAGADCVYIQFSGFFSRRIRLSTTARGDAF